MLNLSLIHKCSFSYAILDTHYFNNNVLKETDSKHPLHSSPSVIRRLNDYLQNIKTILKLLMNDS